MSRPTEDVEAEDVEAEDAVVEDGAGPRPLPVEDAADEPAASTREDDTVGISPEPEEPQRKSLIERKLIDPSRDVTK